MDNDPINPTHYAGRACADIGERLTANGYQILKYCWRLGKKDAAFVELGKAIWYAESESLLLTSLPIRTAPMTMDLPNPHVFFNERTADQPPFTQLVAAKLWSGYNWHELQSLLAVIKAERAKYGSA